MLNIINIIKKLSLWHIFLLSIASAEVFSAIIVSIMSYLLEGRLLSNYLITGAVTSAVVAAFIVSIILFFVRELQIVESELKDSEARYRDLVENIDEVIYTLDIDGFITYVSPAIKSKSGYTQEELLGRSIGDFVYHGDRPRLMEQFQNILSGQLQSSEYRLISKSSHVHWVRASSRPLYDGDQVVGIRGVIADITESKHLENELRQSQKMESIGTLAGGIAHDFNNILYMITGNAELAMEDIPEWNPVHANLKEIKDAGLRAAGIVKKLLNFSRKADVEKKSIGAITVIKDSIKFLRSTIPTTIEIRKNLPEKDVAILADPIQINQVMMNICTNASQGMETSGGVLEIIAKAVNLDEDAVAEYPDLTPNEYLKITVNDTGPGVDHKIIDRIFDPYFTTKEVGKGTGMGLAVVHGIVKNHGGAITVASQPGKETTFTILFPVVAAEPVIEVKPSDEIPHGNETILFVDDEESIVKMNGQMLERLGYKVETKTSPTEALELFQSNPARFDLIISDMTMPQMTGIELSSKIKEVHTNVPVIICTGHNSLIDVEKAKILGIDGYILKPIVKKDIALTIRTVLDKGREKQL